MSRFRAERVQNAALDRRLDRELPLRAAPPAGDQAEDRGSAATAAPERVRPWWETEQNDIAARIRRKH
ncbi:hypothetical protein [Streptomyces spiralis]|uniref:hypothetical protein n=1 Tax=Streptomyces spiralis TaxID=66376 RepID=UPI0036BA53C8